MSRSPLRHVASAGVRVVTGAEPAVLGANLRRTAGNPRLVLRWLAGARAAQIALAALAAFTLFGLPPLLDRALASAYPDVRVREKVLGFLPRSREVSDPRIPVRKRQLLTLAWALTGCVTLVLLVRRIPGTETAGARSAAAADTILDAPGRPGGADGSAPPDPALPIPNGTGRYRIEREIARGSMGVVYAATDAVLERKVALKELSAPGAPDAELVARFRREAQALARLTHPNIVQVHDLMEDAGRLWMVMEMVEGESLAATLERGPLPEEEAARLGCRVAEGLAFAHGKGIIHRDVKPSNILVTRDGTPKVADFGVARVVGTGTGTLPGQVVGSPHYMSPEQASGREADERSDVYSLGVTMFEMLAGVRPFEGDLMSLLAQHVTRPAPSLPDGPGRAREELRTVILRMMAKDPAQRPASMEETARLLRPLCRTIAPGDTPSPADPAEARCADTSGTIARAMAPTNPSPPPRSWPTA